MKAQVLRPWRTRGASTTAIGEINGFDIAALDKDEEKRSGRKLFVDAHVRAVHGYRNPPRPTSKTSTMVDGTGLSKGKQGRITIDSGTAESVIPPDMLEEVPTRSSTGSRAATHYIAANGGRMLNLGEKQVPNGRRPELKRAFPDD